MEEKENVEERFTRAIAFCLKAYRPDDEEKRRYLARWTLGYETSEPAAEDRDLEIALVAGGATKIKGYVFESARLPEIRGASGLLDRINLKEIPALWETIGCKECVIYANGGEVLAFAPKSEGARLAAEIERIYTRETLVAQSVAVCRIFTLRQLHDGSLTGKPLEQEATNALNQLLNYDPVAEPSFGKLVAMLAQARFRRREANPDEQHEISLRGIAHFETAPFARRCSSCERRAAIVNAGISDDSTENLPLCEPCARKRIFGMWAKREDQILDWWNDAEFKWRSTDEEKIVESWATRFERWLNGKTDLRDQYMVDKKNPPLPEKHRIRAARDLNEIAGFSRPPGFIGVVYADGNNMGQLLERLKTPADYHTFANRVYDANEYAVFEALAKNLRIVQFERKSDDRFYMHPFEILSIGGDDLFMIVPAHLALKIACDITKSVENRLQNDPQFSLEQGYTWEKAQRCQKRDGDVLSPQSSVSFSAGVVIADASTPIFYLEDLAGQLLKTAKSRAKSLKSKHHYYGGTIDFMALKSVTALNGTVEQFRQAALNKKEKELRLYARPYTLAETEMLMETIRLLKRSGFPRNQLYRLRQSLHSGREQSTLDYLYFLSRDENVFSARKKIELLWTAQPGITPHPWRKRLENPSLWETIWYDVMELYDFVEKEECDAGDQD